MKIKKPPVAVRVLLGIVSVLLCIALFATMLMTITIANVRVLTDEKNLQTIISQVMFATPKRNAPVIWRQSIGGGGVRLEEPETGLTDMQQMVVDYVFDMLKDLDEEIPVTQEAVEQLLDQSTLPEFLSEKMASIMSDVITGETTTTITTEEITDLVEENKELIQNTLGIEITVEHMEQVSDWLEQTELATTVEQVVKGNWGMKEPDGSVSEDMSASSSIQSSGNIVGDLISGNVSVQAIIDGGIPAALAVMRAITSVGMLLTLVGICAALILLLFLANYWKPYAAVRSVGITAILSALPSVLITVLLLAVPALLTELMQLVGLPGLGFSALTLIVKLTGVVGICVFVGGVAMLAGSIVWGCLWNKKARTPVETPVEQMPVVEEIFAEPVEETPEI